MATDFVETLDKIVADELDKLALTVQEEMRAIVKPHSDTGRENKITITPQGEFSRFVGTTDTGLFYLDRGSGAVNGKHMAFPEPKGWINMGTVVKGTVHITRRRAIEGIHFVRQVADRHR